MKKIKSYNEFLILEKYDDKIRAKLIEMGVTNKNELEKQISLSKRGRLGNYLEKKGNVFTFGILKAIFEDAKIAKKRTNLKKGIFNILPTVIPLSLAPFFPTIAVIGTIFGSSRLAHKVFDTLFEYLNPQSKYSDFIKKMIDTYMKIPEGDVNLKDRFSRVFVVTDRLIEAIKPEVIDAFTTHISNQMEQENDDTRVPDHYIENEFKKYLNENFDVSPEIPLNVV
jgi:hypothetical protein